jgi:ABC-type multidrug transport system ATPase subunit
MHPIVQATGLVKQFKDLTVVNDLSFTVPPGEVYGFLGQNGAGKSTTIRMLLTLVHPTKGRIELFGKELGANRAQLLRRVGAIIEKPDLYKYLTAFQNLQLMARLSGLKLSHEEGMRQLELVGLADRADSKVKTFSQGMKQRLGIACALVHNPDLIILDEPTNGLDPQGIADIRNLIRYLSRERGKTVFISSHLLSEIELIADSMLIIDKGKKVAEGRVSELLNPAHTLLEVETPDRARTRLLLEQSQWAGCLQEADGATLLRLHREEIPALAAYLVNGGDAIQSLKPKHSLEAYFLSLTTANQHVAAYPH